MQAAAGALRTLETHGVCHRIGRLRAPYRAAHMRAGARCVLRHPSEATGYHRRCLCYSFSPRVSSLWWQRRLQPVVTSPPFHSRAPSDRSVLLVLLAVSLRPLSFSSLVLLVPLILLILFVFSDCLIVFNILVFLIILFLWHLNILVKSSLSSLLFSFASFYLLFSPFPTLAVAFPHVSIFCGF